MRNIVIIIIIVIALAGIYYGAYRPLVKAQLYITVQKTAPISQTFDEFVSYYNRIFEYYSPIGNKEIAKFFISNMSGIIVQKDRPEEIARALVEYGESHIYKNKTVHLVQMAYAYDILWKRFRNEEYFKKTEFYYNQVHEIGPRLPHALYGLFILYQGSGKIDEMMDVGEKILELWPGDGRITKIMEVFN